MFNLGLSYFHVPLTTVRHLLNVIVKLDFSNAFNCIRRDLILEAIAARSPETYSFVHSAYSCEPILAFGDREILSREDRLVG